MTGNLEDLPNQLVELRQLIREAHEIHKDLAAAIKHGKDYQKEFDPHVTKSVESLTKKMNDQLNKTITEVAKHQEDRLRELIQNTSVPTFAEVGDMILEAGQVIKKAYEADDKDTLDQIVAIVDKVIKTVDVISEAQRKHDERQREIDKNALLGARVIKGTTTKLDKLIDQLGGLK